MDVVREPHVGGLWVCLAAEWDAREALASAVDTKAQVGLPDVFDCLAYLAAQADSYPEAARLVGAAEAVRLRTGEVPYEI
jgi:hypothetical protein